MQHLGGKDKGSISVFSELRLVERSFRTILCERSSETTLTQTPSPPAPGPATPSAENTAP